MGVKQLVSNILAATRHATLSRDRANRVAPALSNKWTQELGIGQSWMPLSYGEYYPRSSLVYSSIKVRQNAIARVPLRVYRPTESRGRPGDISSRYLNGDLSIGISTTGQRQASEPVGPTIRCSGCWTRRIPSGRGGICGVQPRPTSDCGVQHTGDWNGMKAGG